MRNQGRKRHCLVAAFTVLADTGQRSPGEFESVREPFGAHARFAQIHEEERLVYLIVSRALSACSSNERPSVVRPDMV